MSVLGNVISGIFGAGTAAMNNLYAEQREKSARAENYIYGERAANNADERTRALYADLYSPQAQMQQIRDAGISPSIFYGDMAGISGQTGAQGTGASGINPSVFGLDPMTIAQVNLMGAQTEKVKAETEKTNKESELTQEQINTQIQETNNKWLEGENLAVDNMLKQIELSIEGEYAEKDRKVKYEILQKQCKTLAEELRTAKVNGNISEATEKDVINWYANRTVKSAVDIINAKLQGKLTSEQINDLVSQQVNRQRQSALNEQELYQDFIVNLEQLSLTAKDLDRKEREFMFEQIKEVVNVCKSLATYGAEPTIHTTTTNTTTAHYNSKGQLQGYSKQQHSKTSN